MDLVHLSGAFLPTGVQRHKCTTMHRNTHSIMAWSVCQQCFRDFPPDRPSPNKDLVQAVLLNEGKKAKEARSEEKVGTAREKGTAWRRRSVKHSFPFSPAHSHHTAIATSSQHQLGMRLPHSRLTREGDYSSSLPTSSPREAGRKSLTFTITIAKSTQVCNPRLGI